MADKTNTTASASNGSAAASDKRTKLGFVPVGKLASIADPKAWSDYSKRAEQVAERGRLTRSRWPRCSRRSYGRNLVTA